MAAGVSGAGAQGTANSGTGNFGNLQGTTSTATADAQTIANSLYGGQAQAAAQAIAQTTNTDNAQVRSSVHTIQC